MTREEIERAIAAGAEKRAVRQAKRDAMRKLEQDKQQEESLGLSPDFEQRLRCAWGQLERVYYNHNVLSDELSAEVKALFLPDADDKLRYKAYLKYFHDYETLIFYAWVSSGELCDAAFAFWDKVLSNPGAPFSGNSIVRIFAGRPNSNTLNILKNHREIFLGDNNVFRMVLGEIIERYLREPGMWNFETRAFDIWSKEEKEILEKIDKLF